MANAALPGRLMAPWYADLMKAEQNKTVSAAEIARLIKPHADVLKRDETYRSRVSDLLTQSGDYGSKVRSKTARASLENLLAANRLIEHFPAKIIGAAHFHPGMGVQPLNPPPGWVSGPHVSMKALFGEGTAKAVTNAYYTDDTLFVQVHGESDRKTRMASFPKDVDVSVGFPPNVGPWKLRVIDENGRVIGRGANFSGILPL